MTSQEIFEQIEQHWLVFKENHDRFLDKGVKAAGVRARKAINEIKKLGISSVAIMSNDTLRYQEDSFDNMKLFKKKYNISFPYLFDETQEIAKSYGAVCTPDFFGYNKDGELQYRGRVRELKHLTPVMEKESELLLAMKIIASTNKGPLQQYPSMGCNIKWK